ncbi:hypothetical protein ACLVWU_04820 [Bdellovibrio sp. HCB290]|uniref:hypothetical protein n=1 Tax=Bdellovibrio sp. HCB290 TaxID=3394356 RepID=UPI0039B5BFCC
MKTLIALSMLLLSSVSFATDYEGSGTLTVQQDIVARTPDHNNTYYVGIDMGKPDCTAGFYAGRPFTLKKGTQLQVDYYAREREAWKDGDTIGFPTNGITAVKMSYQAADGYYLIASASCNTKGKLFPKSGLPTVSVLLEKASPIFTFEEQ